MGLEPVATRLWPGGDPRDKCTEYNGEDLFGWTGSVCCRVGLACKRVGDPPNGRVTRQRGWLPTTPTPEKAACVMGVWTKRADWRNSWGCTVGHGGGVQ